MLKILTTMRVEENNLYEERRDAIDQRWSRLFLEGSLLLILVPNLLASVEKIAAEIPFDGVLLTGGNSLLKCGGEAPERDEVEIFLLKYCIDNLKPLLGVCRGMQIIQDFFGVALVPVENHVDKEHSLVIEGHSDYSQLLSSFETVNSYHGWGAYESCEKLNVVARSEDKVVMAVEHSDYPIFGHMWHPERRSPFMKKELALIQAIFSGRHMRCRMSAVQGG